MNDASKNKWIAVTVSIMVTALFFGGVLLYSFNSSVEKNVNNTSDVAETLDSSAVDTSINSKLNPSFINTNQKVMNTTTTPEGLVIEDRVIGVGEEAKAGQTISVHYTGTLEDGTKFDSSLDRGQPIQFTLGVGQVIKGWDQGVAGMKVGGKRRLVIPSALAYGDRAVGNIIPANATLIFEVELVGIQK